MFSSKSIDEQQQNEKDNLFSHDFSSDGDRHSFERTRPLSRRRYFSGGTCFFVLKATAFLVFILFPFASVIALFTIVGRIEKTAVNNVSVLNLNRVHVDTFKSRHLHPCM